MAEEVLTAPAAVADPTPAAVSSDSGTGQSEEDAFAASRPAETEAVATEEIAAPVVEADAQPTEEINLAALETGRPEWLAKVTDPAVKAEIEKLLDAPDFEASLKEAGLPGGKDQLTALQTLATEIDAQDAAIQANAPEGLTAIVERSFSMAPDGGVNLLRAAAQHMAKSSPESWNQISSELLNSSLHAAGIGSDFQTVTSAIAEMRQAIAADDGEAFGRAAGKLLGQPKAEPTQDSNLTRLQERENAARAGEQRAQSENWQMRGSASYGKITTHISTEAGKLLAKVLPESMADSDRATLRESISKEVIAQLDSNAWLQSQLTQLLGRSDGKDYSKANLKASQADFDKAVTLTVENASTQLIGRAVTKIVSEWSTKRAAANQEARNKAKGAPARKDAGAGPAPAAGHKPITEQQQAGMTDEELMSEYRKRTAQARA